MSDWGHALVVQLLLVAVDTAVVLALVWLLVLLAVKGRRRSRP